MDLRILSTKEALNLEARAEHPHERAHAKLWLRSAARIRDPAPRCCRAFLNEEQFEESDEDFKPIVPQPLYLNGGQPHP